MSFISKSPRQASLSAAQSLKLALDYVAEHPDRPLIPVARGGKRPIIKDFPNVATTDPEKIKALARKYAGCNWGFYPEGSGTVVMDVDKKPGKVGAASLAALEKKYGKLPDTETVDTANGGVHFYFKGEHVFRPDGFGKDIDAPIQVLIPGLSPRRRQGVFG